MAAKRKPAAKKKTKVEKHNKDLMVYADHQRRTCLKVSEQDGSVEFITLDFKTGFYISQTSSESFESRYKPLPDYPKRRACELFLAFATKVGATEEVIDWLSSKIDVSDAQRQEILDRNKVRGEAASKSAPKAKKKPGRKTSSNDSPPWEESKKAPAKKAPAKKAPAKKKASGSGKYKSAAQMFRELIMSGKHTDDEIFSKVQNEFGLEEKKRAYVNWYRKDLIKKGENPPEAK